MKQLIPILTILLALALLSGCTEPATEQPTANGQAPVIELQQPQFPLVEGRAENFAFSLDDFDELGVSISQFEGEYTKDTPSIQQFRTFFKPGAYPLVPLDENSFVLTQTITIISSPTSRGEIELRYESELRSERDKHPISIIGSSFAGEKSIMLQSTLEGNDLYKAFIIHANVLNELALLTRGMPSATAKEKLIYYGELAEGKLA